MWEGTEPRNSWKTIYCLVPLYMELYHTENSMLHAPALLEEADV